jgi:heat shock protein HslJ
MPLLALVLSVLLVGCVTSAQGERYRGEYTYGHEVNVFCPEINSQCYWLGPNSSQDAREQLKQIYRDKKPGLYKPVCVVIDGVIDRDSTRNGFAADYDGLIDIESVQGACDETSAITPGDLNHRRWVLAVRNGIPVDATEPPVVLDFGERLFVEIADGCQRFSGFASISGDRILFHGLDFDRADCSAGDLSTRVFADRFEWRVTFDNDGLSLSDDDTRLAFKRDDWR